MSLSKRCEYALRALIDIGLAAELGCAQVRIKDLAAHERISEQFLGQILLQLNEAGWLASRRGRAGGYSLAVPMASLQIGDVVRLVDGPIAPIRCVSVSAYERCSCPDEDHCGLRMLMLDVRTAVSSVLDRHTLADVVQVTLRKMQRDSIEFPLASARRE
jgi:Rrf2 family protein